MFFLATSYQVLFLQFQWYSFRSSQNSGGLWPYTYLKQLPVAQQAYSIASQRIHGFVRPTSQQRICHLNQVLQGHIRAHSSCTFYLVDLNVLLMSATLQLLLVTSTIVWWFTHSNLVGCHEPSLTGGIIYSTEQVMTIIQRHTPPFVL